MTLTLTYDLYLQSSESYGLNWPIHKVNGQSVAKIEWKQFKRTDGQIDGWTDRTDVSALPTTLMRSEKNYTEFL